MRKPRPDLDRKPRKPIDQEARRKLILQRQIQRELDKQNGKRDIEE